MLEKKTIIKTTYKTLNQNSTYTHEDQKSKFIAIAFKINSNTNENQKKEIKQIIKQLKSEHPKSNHTPYAFRLGISNIEIGFSDDGEPTGSAGKPIYFEIKGKELQNILICVVRYFGGIKLGIGGLTKAFGTATKNVIEINNKIIELPITNNKIIQFQYNKLKEIENLCKKNQVEIKNKKFEDNCEFELEIPIINQNKFNEELKLK
jgi:uncharacterized YigZ family protein